MWIRPKISNSVKMIVEFSVKNFRSIKDLQTLSFVATGLKSPEEDKEVDFNNISTIGDNRLLKTIGIYGPNGSGKSNILRALDYFIETIRNEASTESRLGALCDPFLYQDNPNDQESYFQIVILILNKKYRYGFTVKKNQNVRSSADDNLSIPNSSNEIIVSEWLFGPKDINMVELFTREKGEVNKDKLGNKEPIPTLSIGHTLFLTYASAFDKNGICALVRRYLIAWTISNLINGFERFRRNSIKVLEEEGKKEHFLEFLAEFNLQYSDIELDRDSSQPEQILSHEKITLIKTYIDSNVEHKKIRLNLYHNESSGTQKLFDLAGIFLKAFNMANSGLVIIDEIDSHFHPSLLLKMLKFINDPTVNKGNTQLVFTSHDTNMLSPSIMRRDQFYFTEKRDNESTRLYSLADLKGIRNDADFAKQYLAGYYGAIPILEKYIETFDQKLSTNVSLEY